MRYIETLTSECGARLHASTETQLKAKVASSDKSQHKGYPDSLGHVPFVIADPKHREHTDSDLNLCSDDDPKSATVFTACLGFPHLPLGDGTRRKFSVQKLVQDANCDANDVIDYTDETVQTILHERERLRMRAVRDDHPYALDSDTTLTADPVERILITCSRAAERRHNEVTAEGVREVLSFKRNTLLDDLPFGLDTITDEFLDDRIGGKTCAPLLPRSAEHKQVLLYYIDNPDAPLTEVVDETGISRGQFETFRLNLPDPRCYDRDYIASLRFDFEDFRDSLHQWMETSPHSVYSCSNCSYWSYSKQGLSVHKTRADDHTENTVQPHECPNDHRSVETVHSITEESDSDVDTLLDVFETATGRTARADETETEPTTTDVTTADSETEPVEVEFDDLDKDVDSSTDMDDTESETDGTEDVTESPNSPADAVTNADIKTQYADKIEDIRDENGFTGGRFKAKMQNDGYGPYAWLIEPSDVGGDWHYLGKIDPDVIDETNSQPETEQSPDTSEPETADTPEESLIDIEAADLTASDILPQSDQPIADIADALFMSQSDVVNRLLDSLTEAELEKLYQQFDATERDVDEHPLDEALVR